MSVLFADRFGLIFDQQIATPGYFSVTHNSAAPATASGVDQRKKRAIQVGWAVPDEDDTAICSSKGQMVCEVPGRAGLWEVRGVS
jgi:hypothetical protein